jgi:hypothetical protein
LLSSDSELLDEEDEDDDSHEESLTLFFFDLACLSSLVFEGIFLICPMVGGSMVMSFSTPKASASSSENKGASGFDDIVGLSPF